LQANGCCCDLVLSHRQQLFGQEGAYHCLQANGACNTTQRFIHLVEKLFLMLALAKLLVTTTPSFKAPSSSSGFFLLSREFFPLPCESWSDVSSPVPLNGKDSRGLFCCAVLMVAYAQPGPQ
jgi:hypothetical protein